MIALEGDSGEAAAVGSMAEALSGREPEGIAVVWPFIADVEASTLMLNAFLHRAHVHRASCGRWP